MADWNRSGGNAEWNQDSGASANWDSGAGSGGQWNGGDSSAATGFDANTGGDAFTSQDARGDVSDSACRNCGQEGHMARDCTEPKKSAGGCFNCGEEGHMKGDCPNPRKFTGTCRDCNQEGHQARDCPNKPKICKQCLQEGHETIECKNPKVIDWSKVPDKTVDEAWALLKQASDERDLDDVKEGVQILAKADKEMTYLKIEKEFRSRNFKVYLIATEKPNMEETHTIVTLQGEVGKKYAVTYQYSEKPQRPVMVHVWPKSPEENIERLADAGVPVDRGVPKCNNCGVFGHTKRKCPDELIEVERVQVKCALCDEVGHRVRDCTQERQKPREPRACKICEETDHMARDCPNKPAQTCHKCGEEGHMSKDCDVIKCRNCDAIGHESRDCTAPKDWSRVKCRNCGEMGHTVKKCKQPIKEDENAAPAGGFGDASGGGFGDTATFGDAPAADAGASGGWDNPAPTGGSAHNDWETGNSNAVAVGGAGDGW